MEKLAQEFLPSLLFELVSCVRGGADSANSGGCLWKSTQLQNCVGTDCEEQGASTGFCCPSGSEAPGQQGLCLVGSMCRPAGLVAASSPAPSLLPGSWRFPLTQFKCIPLSVWLSSCALSEQTPSRSSMGKVWPLRWQLGILLASAKSLNTSLNKPKISIPLIKWAEIHLGTSSVHVFWKCEINLVKMRNVINSKPLLSIISPANSLVSIFDGTCWRLGTAEKWAFGGLLWTFLIMRFTNHSYCHSSPTFSFL